VSNRFAQTSYKVHLHID